MKTVIVWNESRIVIHRTNKGNEDACRERLQRLLRHRVDDPRWQILCRDALVDVPDRMLSRAARHEAKGGNG